MKVEIDKYLKEKSHIESTFPPTIVVGPFYVLVDTLRVQLGKKCKELARALLEYMVQRLKVETDEICGEFNKISRKLFDRPNAIEVSTYVHAYIYTVHTNISIILFTLLL